MKLIFDSNVFDELVNGIIDTKFISANSHEIFITHIQVDEMNECTDKEKRALLFNFMAQLRPKRIPTESFMIGKSRLGAAKLGDGNLVDKLRNGNVKNTNDALIGETAIKNDLTLVTNDKKFKAKVIELGGKAITVSELVTE